MTTPDRPCLALPSLPSSWGKGRSAHYAQLAAAYRGCPVDEVHVRLADIARFLCDAPRCTDSIASAAWGQLRNWNNELMGDTHASPDQAVVCEFCGEFRDGALVGEASTTTHMRPTGRRGPAVFVVPNHCQHHLFEIVCRTCESRCPVEMPVVVDETDPGAAPEDLPPLGPNSEYGPN